MRHRAQNHAISEENIKKTLEDWHDRKGEEYEDITFEDLDKWLTTFQDQLEDQDLAEELNFRRRKGRTKSLPNSEPQDGYGWYISTYDYILLECLTYNPGDAMWNWFPDDHRVNQDDSYLLLFDAHSRQFDELVEKRELTRQGTGQKPQPTEFPVVIFKTYAWIGAESSRNHELTMLIEAGLTPAEAIDFMRVEEGFHSSATSWAEKRNCSPQAISQNVKRAKKKLREKYGK